MLYVHFKAVLLLIVFGFFSTVVFAASEKELLPEGMLTAEQIKQVFVGNTVAANAAGDNKQKLVIYFTLTERFGRPDRAG